MAGDWIKVEHATTDKAEVLRIAELLGVSRRECLGLLFDFWVWLDKNCHADVTLMSRKSLDEVTHTPGFSACLDAVGWAKFDDKTGLMTISNFDRHNGNTAKNRALGKDRKAAERSRKSHAETVTREEKRREEKPKPTCPHSVRPEVWAQWLAYKGSQKATSVALQAKRLNEWTAAGHDPNSIIETSIANGWAGLFRPDGASTKTVNGERRVAM